MKRRGGLLTSTSTHTYHSTDAWGDTPSIRYVHGARDGAVVTTRIAVHESVFIARRTTKSSGRG